MKLITSKLYQQRITEAKKGKKNKSKDCTDKSKPYAVCNTTVDKDKSPAKFDRCVREVDKED